MRPVVLTLAACTLFAGVGPVWAVCTTSGGASAGSGTLSPNAGETVDCAGANSVSIENEAATGITVNVGVGADITTTPTFAPINLGSGATINNNGSVTGDGAAQNRGAITIRGAGNRIENTGTIEGRDSEAIQGSLNQAEATGTVLVNSGVISTTSAQDSTVRLSTGSQVDNSGQILNRGAAGAIALAVGDGSRIQNRAAGRIEAEETQASGGGSGLNALRLLGASTLLNYGTIRVIADLSGTGLGAAVTTRGDGARILNRGTIDAARGSTAISSVGATTIFNSGTLLGGAGGAIDIDDGEGSAVTLQPGSQLSGQVSVRATETVLKTLQDLGGNQQLFDLCQQNPRPACYKTVVSLPNQATLGLEGAGSEDDRFTGFNRIEKRGAGTWTLGTDLQAGSASDGYQSGDFRGPLTVGVQDAGGQLTLTGAITDNADGTPGALTKQGSGQLVLSGSNTYSGPTTIGGGDLLAQGGNAIGDLSAVTIASGASLSLASGGSGETIGSLAGGGDLFLNGHQLRAGGDDSSTTFSGAINDPGALVKLGTGTLRLSGNSPSIGTISVVDGTLDMAGTTAMATAVQTRGTLIGNGTVGALLNNGLVAPGNNLGTLSVTGDYSQQASGTLEIEIAPNGSRHDLLAVGGTAQLGGRLAARTEGQASLVLTPGMDGAYTVLSAGGGVAGRFADDPGGTYGAFIVDTLYNPGDVQLVIDYVGFAPVQRPGTIPGTGTANQISKAVALDRIPISSETGLFSSGNADFDRVLLEIANETPAQLAATYNAIIAEPYAAFMTVLLEQNDFYAETVLERAQLCSARGRGSLAGGYAPQQVVGGAPITDGCPNHERHGVWVDATWLEGNIDGDDGLSGYDYRLAGAVLGADTAIGSNMTVGGAFGFGQPQLDNYELAQAEIDGSSYLLSAYGALTQDRWEFFGLLGYTFGNYESDRRIRFGSIDRTAKGDFDSQGFIASAKAAYDYPVRGFDLIPEVGLTYSYISQDGFTEKGADSLDLKVDQADAYSLVSSLGVRVGTEFLAGDTSIRPQLLARYEYDWNASDDAAHDIVSTFAGVPMIGPIDVVGQNRGEHGFTLAGGITAQVTETANLFAGANYRWNSNGEEYGFGVGARMAW